MNSLFIYKMLEHRIMDQKAEYLDLRLHEINDDIMDILFEVHTQTVSTLVLHDNLITWQGLKNMSCSNWTSLAHLDLNNNRIGSKGCKYLSKVHLSKIEQVFLIRNEIGGEGLLHLSKTQWHTLQHIHLSENNFKGNGHMVSIAKANWSNLTDINLQGRDVLNITEALPLLLMPLHCIEKIILAWDNQQYLTDLDLLYFELEEKFGYSVIRLQ